MNTEVIRKDWVASVVNERYRLDQRLGGAGQSNVYLCHINENEEQKAVIKLFPAPAEGSGACLGRWNTAAGLYHPHLIRVLDTGRAQIEDTALLYVVIEYAPEILSEILPDRPLSANETREMIVPLLDALAYLHENGMVHGRLKPSNIMAVDDVLKLSSDNVRSATASVAPPQVLEIYDAPETERGEISPAADMWSLGVTLVEVLTRIPPLWNRSGQSEPIVPPSVPEPFAQIARECLRLDPANRCTVGEVRAHLDSGTTIPHRPIKHRTAWEPMRTSPFGLLAAVALIGAVAMIAVIELRHTTPRAPKASSPAAQTTPSHSAPAAEPGRHAAAPVASLSSAPVPMKPHASVRAASGLSLKGGVAQQVMPNVPEKASRTIHGTVIVSIRLNVDANGSVDDASIASAGPSKYFANLALAAARKWKFAPAQMNGHQAPSIWLLYFRFRQSGTEVTPLEQSP